MEDMEAYLRQQSTDWLKTVLRADFAGIAFPVESVFLVCKILAEREPPLQNSGGSLSGIPPALLPQNRRPLNLSVQRSLCLL